MKFRFQRGIVVFKYALRFEGMVMFTVPPVTEALLGFMPSSKLKLFAEPLTVVGDRMLIVPPLILKTLSGYGSEKDA